LVHAWLEAGVAVAPGADFGAGFEQHVRLCFTGEPVDRLELALHRWSAVLGAAGARAV
jgi:aspartate/methionine/tyrosine aminotransferase